MSVRAARAITFLPTSVDPVNITKSTSSMSASPTEPPPGATMNTSSGSPHSRRPSAIRSDVSGVRLAGFSTAELPAARAGMQSPKSW